MKPLMGVRLLRRPGSRGAQEENPLQRRTVHLTGVSDDADRGSGLIRTDVRSLQRVEEQLKSTPVTSTEPLAPAGISTPSR